MTADLCGRTASAERRRSNHDGWKQEEVSKHDMKLYQVWVNAGTALIARNSADNARAELEHSRGTRLKCGRSVFGVDKPLL